MSVASFLGYREVQFIRIKRNHINLAAGTAGHWWFVIGDPFDRDSESYGWWPKNLLFEPAPGEGWLDVLRNPERRERLLGVIEGVEGELNGVTTWGGTLTTDPLHDNPADEEFHPLVELADTRSDTQIAECLRAFARAFANEYGSRWQWQFGFGWNCHTFQREALRHCHLFEPNQLARRWF